MSSTRNPRVAEAIRLHRSRNRRDAGQTLVEGPTLVLEALAHGGRLVRVFAVPGDPVADEAAEAGIDVVTVEPQVLERISTTDTPRSPVAVASIVEGRLPATGDILVAWGVGDPGNVGTLLRTAAALDVAFAVGPGTADPWSPKVVRAGAGAHFRRPPSVVEGLEGLRSGGREVVATVVHGGVHPAALTEAASVAILVGDEAHGLPADVVDRCDRRVTIPMATDAESLNAAVAGAIVAYTRVAGGDSAPG
ncbi:MAG: RNA methyltransferase [Acidimicrobiia bacterium]|nr:RNA methyltransferase [Acidimicrobiia bacterium]